MALANQPWSVRSGVVLAGLAVCLVVLLKLAIDARWTTDDALITFRYVDNLAAGHGLVYNLGERLEAFSSPLFVVLLTPARLLGANPFTTAQVLGVGFTIVELGLIFVLLARYGWMPLAALLAGALFVSDRIVWIWATGGLETSLASALTLASFVCAAFVVLPSRAEAVDKLVVPASVVHLLLAAARPEGIAYYPMFLVALLIGGRREAADARRRAARSLAIVGLGALALLALRYAYYGALLPHSYQAKLAGVPIEDFGQGYVHAFAVREGAVGVGLAVWLMLLAMPITAVVLARRARPRAPGPEAGELRELITIAGIGLIYVALGVAIAWREGGDYMTDFRLLRPIVGIACASVAAVIACGSAERESALAKVPGLAAALLLVVVHLQRQREPTPIFADAPPPRAHKLGNATTEAEAARFRAALERFAEPGDAILTDVTGMKGYGHQLRTVDATGLTTANIENNFYLRPLWATKTYRDRLPGHARWPKLEFLTEQGFAMITPKLSTAGPEVPEITEGSHRRYRRYRFLHVTLGLGDGEYLRFFTALSADELAARARAGDLELCWRAPRQDQPVCAGTTVAPVHDESDRARGESLAQPPGIEALERRPATTPEDAARQYFGAARAADCEWLRATTAGVQAERDAQLTCEQLRAQLEHMAPVRLWSIDSVRPAREPHQRLLQVRFFLDGKDRVKTMRVAELDGEWRVARL